jgi:hypothetical protein
LRRLEGRIWPEFTLLIGRASSEEDAVRAGVAYHCCAESAFESPIWLDSTRNLHV